MAGLGPNPVPAQTENVMHEMPFTQALIELAVEKAQGHRIHKIHIQMGWMSSIVPASVQVFFDVLSKHTLAEQAGLAFEITPIKLGCHACSRRIELPFEPGVDPRRALAKVLERGCFCGEGKLILLDGMRFELSEIELAQ